MKDRIKILVLGFILISVPLASSSKLARLFLSLLLILCFVKPVMAETRIGQKAEIHALPAEVKELIANFELIDKAINTKDLESMMNYYSRNYAHLGADRNDIRKIWATLFQEYKELIIGHTFTRIYIERGKHMASVVCTGLMFGINVHTGEKERIDGWIEEIHYLVHEDGEWKILGHEVETLEPGRFGAAFHPLF
mgnify:FL=1